MVHSESIWKETKSGVGEVAVAVRPKAFAVLRCLVDQAGRIVSREQIEQAVWPGTQVGPETLRSCIKQIRQVLGDSASISRWCHDGGGWLKSKDRKPQVPLLILHAQPPVPHIVGREAELTQLQNLRREDEAAQKCTDQILGWCRSKVFRTASLAPMFFGAGHEPASDIKKVLKKLERAIVHG